MTDLLDHLRRAIGDIIGAHGPAVNAAQSYAPGDYSIHFFLQIAVILLVCRITGWAAKKWFGQPQVVGEMIAGVLLGPSLLGLFFPDFQAVLFPKETRNILYVVAQFGGQPGPPGQLQQRSDGQQQAQAEASHGFIVPPGC